MERYGLRAPGSFADISGWVTAAKEAKCVDARCGWEQYLRRIAYDGEACAEAADSERRDAARGTVDISPQYMLHPRFLPHFMWRREEWSQARTKTLVVLRDPVALVRSTYNWMRVHERGVLLDSDLETVLRHEWAFLARRPSQRLLAHLARCDIATEDGAEAAFGVLCRLEHAMEQWLLEHNLPRFLHVTHGGRFHSFLLDGLYAAKVAAYHALVRDADRAAVVRAEDMYVNKRRFVHAFLDGFVLGSGRAPAPSGGVAAPAGPALQASYDPHAALSRGTRCRLARWFEPHNAQLGRLLAAWASEGRVSTYAPSVPIARLNWWPANTHCGTE